MERWGDAGRGRWWISAWRAVMVAVALAGCGSGASPQGGEQQHCYPNHSCNDGLMCLSDVCVRPATGGAGGQGRGGAGGSGSGGMGGSVSTGGLDGNVGSGGNAGAGGVTATGGIGVGGATGGSAAAGRGGAIAGSGGATGGTGGGKGGAAAVGFGGFPGVSCGNGVLDPGEGCDDHNKASGDGCSVLCQVEADWLCPTVGSLCTLRAACGDGVLASREVCDDGNTADGDGCSADCQTIDPSYECRVPGRRCVPWCGDGVKIAGEGCDDGNRVNGDGCSAVCQVEIGASCTGPANGKSTCTLPTCGNGVKEGNEGCDCGTSNVGPWPSGCNGPNGLFFGDATGCSKTCTKEPSCRDAAGKTQACAVTCGNGGVEQGEDCDDGNSTAGDGCSPTCTLESGFSCSAKPQDDGVDCKETGNTGKCLQLPVLYRDFKSEHEAGGHPDFFYLGAAIAGGPAITGVNGQTGATPFTKRYCVPNSAGPAKKLDATSRCWDMAQASLPANGKPAFNPSRTGAGGNPLFCDCQFIDWSHDGNAGHVPSYGATNSPTSGLIYTEGAAGHPMYRGPAPVVTSATTFGQWWTDSTYTSNTHSVGTLELRSIGGGQYQYASQVNLVTGGFFPLDPPAHGFPLYTAAPTGPGTAPLTVGTEAMTCNLWPYWYSSTAFGAGNGCRGDQFLLPPSLFPPDTIGTCPTGMNCSGKWYLDRQGWYHDFWFTDETRALFTYTSDFSLQFQSADDLFVYINGILVVDLGGVHQALPAKVTVAGANGTATIQEGGSLDATGTGLLPCTGADPYTAIAFNLLTSTDGYGHANCNGATCDCRTRTVNLGLAVGRTYEIAVFGANRHPVESSYQITLNGLQTSRTTCTPRCGDGMRTGDEECDCGNSATPSTDPACGGLVNSATAYGSCTTSCKLGPYCGDAIVSHDEQCDLGTGMNTGTYGELTGCAANCRFPHYCGDGNLDTTEGEQCDLGPTNGTVGARCSSGCQIVL